MTSGLIWMVSLVIAAVAVRSWRLNLGLPDFLEEAIPLRLAMSMRDPATGAIDWNPHSFNYPSLSIYLHFFIQQIVYNLGRLQGTYANWADYLLCFYRDPTPMVLAARSLSVLSELAAIVGVVMLGNRLQRPAGWLAGSFLTFMPSLIETSRSIFCDSIMVALTIWSLERMLAWYRHGSSRALFGSAVLIGLATGAKYPAMVLLLPLAYLAYIRSGVLGLRPWALAAGVALGAFLITTPYAILDGTSLWRDLSFEANHARTGHLGSLAQPSFLFHSTNVVRNLGWLGTLLLLPAACMAIRGVMRVEVISVWIALVGFGLPISLARIDAERYLVPVLYVGALLASLAAVVLWRHIGQLAPRRLPQAAGILAAAAILLQPLIGGSQVAYRGGNTTQLQARRWLEKNLGQDELLVQEGYGARLPTVALRSQVMASPEFAVASTAAQQLLAQTSCYHVIAIPLGASGRIETQLRNRMGAVATVEVLPHASALTQVFYEPSAYKEVDVFLTSGAVRGRFEADPIRYPVQCALYRLLDSKAEQAVRIRPRGSVVGPEITIYRLGPRWREALQGRELHALWWTGSIPLAAQERIMQLIGNHSRAGLEPAKRVSEVAPWVTVLWPVFESQIRPWLLGLSVEYASLDRFTSAVALAEAIVALRSGDVEATPLASLCYRKLGRLDRARETLESALAGGDPDGLLSLEYARVLLAAGDAPAARLQLERMLGSGTIQEHSPIETEARRLLSEIQTSG